MKSTFSLSYILRDTEPYKNYCPKCLDGECEFYDEWEPENECLTNNGKDCLFSKLEIT